ncbi:hypothetical protein SAMN02745124_02978 [Desulfofustis glycolicus DSM 9705]|uniref:Uncharacterized protein n=1 Tax=Desulfofustis glycolicus DSM 9705 TaxID=1121409 RepID=A0A1M5XEZ9_9BACT|nr:hypothetical protein SAMN02745124_02978 [Desulfofustis glycolicus DSM 9705]
MSLPSIFTKRFLSINGKIAVLFGESFQLPVYFNIGAFLLVHVDLCKFSSYQRTLVTDDEASPDLPHIISFVSLATHVRRLVQ